MDILDRLNKHLKYTLILLLFFFACAKPKQPQLTEKERLYFIDLKKGCHCNVSREVDPRKTKLNVNSKQKGWYILSFDSVPKSAIAQGDSLRESSYAIALKLHNEILGESYVYSYGYICIVYNYPTGSNSETSVSFSFDLTELEKVH